MILYPALDLLNGKAVRLTKGDYSTAKMYSENPADVLARFHDQGATFAHMVDLNGARDPSSRQKDRIEPLLKNSKLKIQIGGGVRVRADAEQLVAWGADRVVLGSAAVADPALVEELLKALGPDRLTLAVDVHIGTDGAARAAIKGWSEVTDQKLEPLIARDRAAGLSRVLCTDISRDGAAAGPNPGMYRALHDMFPGLEIQASGGVRDLRDLAVLNDVGAHSAIIGRALYEGTLDLREALNAC